MFCSTVALEIAAASEEFGVSDRQINEAPVLQLSEQFKGRRRVESENRICIGRLRIAIFCPCVDCRVARVEVRGSCQSVLRSPAWFTES